jgi:hypothetical protein
LLLRANEAGIRAGLGRDVQKLTEETLATDECVQVAELLIKNYLIAKFVHQLGILAAALPKLGQWKHAMRKCPIWNWGDGKHCLSDLIVLDVTNKPPTPGCPIPRIVKRDHPIHLPHSQGE